MKKEKLTKKDFDKLFPSDDVCLAKIFELRYGSTETCHKCNKPFKYHKLKGLKLYSCQFCGHNIAPTADTIYHKSSTPLTDWFYAMYLFSVSKNGVSAKELERQLGVTYKTAWRIANRIRLLLADNNQSQLSEIVEIDETYVGGARHGKRGRGAEAKTPVIGVVERKGEVRAKVVTNTKSSTIKPFVKENIAIDTQVMSDEYSPYKSLSKMGYSHDTVNHGSKEYARGLVHTNTIEGFWSQLKNCVNGTYRQVSPKYLQRSC